MKPDSNQNISARKKPEFIVGIEWNTLLNKPDKATEAHFPVATRYTMAILLTLDNIIY